MEDDVWVKNEADVPVVKPKATTSEVSTSESIHVSYDTLARLTTLDLKMDALKELILSQQTHLDKIKEVTISEKLEDFKRVVFILSLTF
ncbi:hypothetical protein K7X08_000959 [Anisodus acutangulus]|uniref:Uncharacterized protein n=1 Tax=Anisodus acutangulus TaxID=402998 RepID=A0A9Q1RMJ7_9SOLA|nr:hypothetical protein K7X08_000959 [Anisodus acutangulus]